MMLSKYTIFYTLNEQDKISFLFINVDYFVCKKSVILFSNLSRKGNESQDVQVTWTSNTK